MMKRPDTGQNIALSVTIVVALLLLILLMGDTPRSSCQAV